MASVSAPVTAPAASGSSLSGRSGPAGVGGAGAYVLDQFREFYTELQNLRDIALRSGHAPDSAAVADPYQAPPPGPPPTPAAEGGRPPPPPLPGLARPELGEAPDAMENPDQPPEDAQVGLTAEAAVRQLQTLLEMQALEAGRRGGEYGLRYYKEAQYVMAALADEIFINLDWPGRDSWRNDLLETRLFGTYNAGDAVFAQLDRLLKAGDRIQTEIAIVYLLALTLGFRGRYAGGRHEAKVADYRRQLYYTIYSRRPQLEDPSARLVPEAYQHTQPATTARLLPSPSRWLWLLGGCVMLYLVASHFVYLDVLGPLMDVLEAGNA
jgi:type VI secretion system protein ImpK